MVHSSARNQYLCWECFELDNPNRKRKPFNLHDLQDELDRSGYRTYCAHSPLHNERCLSCNGFMISEKGKVWAYLSNAEVDWFMMAMVFRHITGEGHVAANFEHELLIAVESAEESVKARDFPEPLWETQFNGPKAVQNVMKVLRKFEGQR